MGKLTAEEVSAIAQRPFAFARLITKEAEIISGALMLSAAKAEGHRSAFPANMRPVDLANLSKKLRSFNVDDSDILAAMIAPMRASEIAVALNIPSSAASDRLSSMRRRGLVRAEKTSSSVIWERVE